MIRTQSITSQVVEISSPSKSFMIHGLQRDEGAVEILSPDQEGAVRKAIERARSHTTIVLSPGTYIEDAPIVIAKPGIFLCSADGAELSGGSEHGACICASYRSNQPLFRIESEDVTISNLAIEVDFSTSEDERARSCILIDHSSNARIEGCSITTNAGKAIEITGKSKPTIIDSVIKDCMM